MKYILFLLTLFFVACNNESRKDKQQVSDDSIPAPVKPQPDTVSDSIKLFRLADSTFTLLQKLDLQNLALLVHPLKGLRFSPYGYIDTSDSKHFTIDALKTAKPSDVYIWGDFDGSGDPIRFSIAHYFRQFVTNADYLKAPERSFNHFIGFGNSLNNLRQIYPGCVFVEYYFPGFDKKYEGMDWTCLRLVFELHEGENRLVAIVHDQWTI